MSLAWLAPGALLLAAMIAGPLLAHLSRQKPSQRLSYGAMMLLNRLVKRLRRRRRLRDPLLFLLRALLVLALAMVAAGPQLLLPGEPPEIGASGRLILVVDDSMSMGLEEDGAPLVFHARDKALSLVRSLSPGVQLGLVRLGGQAEALTQNMTDQHGRVVADLEALEPGYGSTDLAGGLAIARRLLSGEPGEIVVFSDEAGPRTIGDAMGELRLLAEKEVSIIPRTTRADAPANLTVAAAEYGDGLEGGSITVQVVNYGEEPAEALTTVGLPDGSEITAFVEVPGGGDASERFTVPPEVPGGVAWARVEDPALDKDNTRYFHLPRVGADRVMVVDGDPGPTPVRSEVYFLERALAPWSGSRQGVLPEVTAPGGVTELDPDKHKVVFLANVSDPGPMAALLTEFVRGGGGVVISMGSNVTPDRYNGPLRDLLPSPLRKVRSLVALDADEGVPLTLPDLGETLFKAFSRAGRGSFARIRTRRVMTLEPYEEGEDVRTLLRYEGGVPALVERQVGRGRVLLWTGTIDADWGNFPLQAAYMPLVQRVVNYLGGAAPGGGGDRLEGRVGEEVVVELPTEDEEPEVLGPDGQPVAAEIERAEGIRVRFVPPVPGGYTLEREGAPPLARVAVNVDPQESDVRIYDDLQRVEADLDPETWLQRVDLGRQLLAVVIALLLLQSLLGSRKADEASEAA